WIDRTQTPRRNTTHHVAIDFPPPALPERNRTQIGDRSRDRTPASACPPRQAGSPGPGPPCGAAPGPAVMGAGGGGGRGTGWQFLSAEPLGRSDDVRRNRAHRFATVADRVF